MIPVNPRIAVALFAVIRRLEADLGLFFAPQLYPATKTLSDSSTATHWARWAHKDSGGWCVQVLTDTGSVSVRTVAVTGEILFSSLCWGINTGWWGLTLVKLTQSVAQLRAEEAA